LNTKETQIVLKMASKKKIFLLLDSKSELLWCKIHWSCGMVAHEAVRVAQWCMALAAPICRSVTATFADTIKLSIFRLLTFKRWDAFTE
jgi:hypothetical protein